MTEPTKRAPRKRAPRKAAEAAAPQTPAGGAQSGEGAPAGPTLTEWPAPAAVPVHEAWAAVMRDVQAIGKDSLNEDQHFRFRGIDATMGAAGPVLRKHGVFVLPESVEVIESERYESKRGAQMHGMVTRHNWRIYGPLGDTMPMQTLGQAADASDKVASKASSVAYRTALLQSLTVPTGDRDPDADSPERGKPSGPGEPDPRQEWWDGIKAAGGQLGINPTALAGEFRNRYGHIIDGPDATAKELEEYLEVIKAAIAKRGAEQAQKQAGEPDPADSGEAATPEPAAETSESSQEAPTDPPATDEPPAAPEASQAAAQARAAASDGRDPRQTLWDEILEHGKRLGWAVDQIRADFRAWSTDVVDGGPAEIDGPKATADILTRYAHILRGQKRGEAR